MFKFLFDRLKHVQRLHRTIEKIKDSGARSHRRTFKYLYRKLNESIRYSREDENNNAVQQNLNPKEGGAPCNAADEKPKGEGGKGGERGRDKSRGRDQSQQRRKSLGAKGDKS